MAHDSYLSRRQKYEVLRGQLENERSTFLSHWRDLADFILPRRPRFFVSDVNKGDRRSQKIIDTTPSLAARTLASGMMSGVTSPARPWFRLTTPDPDMAEFGAVKDWLHIVTQRMQTMFLKSNIYNTLPMLYKDLGVFGTAPMYIEEDFENVINSQSLPIGSYMIAKDSKGRVNTFMREFRMTVRQIVQTFGEIDQATGKPNWGNFSSQIKSFWDRGEYETWIDIRHVIEPNQHWDPNKVQSKFKKYTSCYYEIGTYGGYQGNYIAPSDDRFLRESGYDYFPVLCPRWEVTGEDVYGTNCPGMEALGDIKQLQLGERRGAQAIEKMINPPMVAPTSMRTHKNSILPGDINYVDIREGQQGFRPAHEIQFRIDLLEGKQDQIRRRIQRCFYEDLFLMLASSDRRQITAREIDERHEEKLLALGPVLEQLNQDLLDPMIDIGFDISLRQGQIPEAPQELQGMPLKVEYISIMAQAQKLVGISGLERFAVFVNNVATVSPAVMDKVDTDQLIDEYGDAVGVSPRVVRPDEDVAAMRSERARAQQQQAQAEAAAQSAKTVKDLSQTSIEDDSALRAMLDQAQAGALAESVEGVA